MMLCGRGLYTSGKKFFRFFMPSLPVHRQAGFPWPPLKKILFGFVDLFSDPLSSGLASGAFHGCGFQGRRCKGDVSQLTWVEYLGTGSVPEFALDRLCWGFSNYKSLGAGWSQDSIQTTILDGVSNFSLIISHHIASGFYCL